jgi:hypothetical protein
MSLLRSVEAVCDVAIVSGARARPDAPPDLLVEVPHGATRATHFREVEAALGGDLPEDLEAFFFVNTDVGAPEMAMRLAWRVVEAEPERSVLVVRSRIPRTFVDCNRLIPPDARGAPSKAGGVTPGLMPWVREEADRTLLLRRYAAYVDVAAEAFDVVCGAGGTGLMLHTYAPRSVEVPVDEEIVARLRAAYAPDQVGRWPLRPEVDFITTTPDGEVPAAEGLVATMQAACAGEGLASGVAKTYPLHPSTMAHAHARRHPGRTLCLEVRRDLLVERFTPFREMDPEPGRVDRLARVLAGGRRTWWASRA